MKINSNPKGDRSPSVLDIIKVNRKGVSETTAFKYLRVDIMAFGKDEKRI